MADGSIAGIEPRKQEPPASAAQPPPAQVFRPRQRVRSEHDFDYFL